MRIGLVVDHFDPRRGGVEHWTYQLAIGLLRLGHEVHVVAGGFERRTDPPKKLDDRVQSVERDWRTARSHSDLPEAVPHEPERQPKVIEHRIAANQSRLARANAAEQVLRKLSLDVVHDMGIGWYCDIFQPHGGSRLAAFGRNLLLVPPWLRPWKQFAARCLPRYRQFDILMERQYASAPIVLALSQMVRRDLKRLHAVSDDRIRLIYNGVDTHRFTPDHRADLRAPVRRQLQLDDDILFLIAAHNLRLKGLPAILRALAMVTSDTRRFHLLVLGGKRLGSFRRSTKRLGLTGHVSFLGPVEDVTPYYAAADVYVQPTFYDPCSLVVLEALACGLPVITSRYNGAAELMTTGVHGYILNDPTNDRLLAEQMAHLFDRSTRERMGNAARKLALQHSFSDNVRNVVRVYEEIVQEKQHSYPGERGAA